jgi:hypothetical protein
MAFGPAHRSAVHLSESNIMPNTERYRKLAEEAQRRADDANEPRTKEMYDQLAASWRNLADQAARQS